MVWWTAIITLIDGSVIRRNVAAPNPYDAERVVRSKAAPHFGWNIKSFQIV